MEFCICPSLSTTLNTVPAFYICGNRRLLLPLPYFYPYLQFSAALLLLLAGDVNVNPGPTHNFWIATINARSMRGKAAALSDLVHSKSIDILSVTETWLTKRETPAGLADVAPRRFTVYHVPRVGRRGGGVGLLVSSQFKFENSSIPAMPTFEARCGEVSNGKFSPTILNTHRPYGNNVKVNLFFKECQAVLSHLASLPHELVVISEISVYMLTLNLV